MTKAETNLFWFDQIGLHPPKIHVWYQQNLNMDPDRWFIQMQTNEEMKNCKNVPCFQEDGN